MSGTKGDKTVYRSLGLGGFYGGGAEGMIDVRNGKVLRVRPFRFDEKYDRDQIRTWKIEKDGKVLEPRWKSMPSPYSLSYKKRVYSPNRIKYPLIRVDWDPHGERNPQNRGKSKFRRASWEEVTTIIANEITRIHAKYGVNAILMQGDGHGECKTINTPHGQPGLLLDHMGGFTLQVRNPDSWEGWYWGAKHVWGQGVQGNYWPAANIVKDSTEHTQMCLFWGCDPETTPWGFTGQFASKLMYFWRDIGIKQVYVCPDLNYGAAVHADKWIPVLPNTDVAMQLAIAYTWIKEGSYDKDYVATHVVGFDKFSAYVMGETDGVPKTPAWASPKCGVPEWTIKALAREWSRKTTSIAHYFGGGYIRGPYSHEPARMEVCLLGMQGLGKPGVHQHQLTYWGMPRMEGLAGTSFWNPEIAERLAIPPLSSIANWQESALPKTLVHTHLKTEEPLKFMGAGAIEGAVANQFIEYQFPIATKDGARIRMMWTDCPCRTTCWNGGNDTEEALQSEQVECIIAQHPWLENDCLFSDIILPANTYMEVDDIVTNVRQGGQFADVMLCDKAIEPIGESKSDYEIVYEISKKLGYDQQVSEGLTTEDLQRKIFGYMGLERMISWEEFREKGYYLYQVAEDWEKDPPGWRKFADDPEKHPLGTPSKKLEFYSERLAKHFPDDKERPPSPQWVEKSEMHDERLSSPRAKNFPLLLMSNHGRWRVHAQCDDITWTREAPTCKITGPDGYKYEPIWIHTSEAKKRGIQHGDIIKIFNERGIVLGGAYVTERLRPGVAYIDHGARIDPIILGKVDRGGAINTIAPTGTTSKNAVGQATSGYLVEVAKVTGEDWDEWRAANPEAFARPYDPAAGLRFEAWVVQEDNAQ
ncbi:MAG: molybdopterin-dependent oxidoreductase [Alphaproteobacteria bacterium]|nr:molybdopterin-dependent oxidoreductase [Alphaproteobacteria bacterium]